MQSPTSLHELKTLILSYHPAVAIETLDEERVQSLLETASSELDQPLFTWSISRGLARHPSKHAILASTNAPLLALRHIAELTVEGIFFLKDFSRHIEDPALARELRDLIQSFNKTKSCFVITGEHVNLPNEIKNSVVYFDLPMPSKEELNHVVDHTITSLRHEHVVDVQLNDQERSTLLDALGGLTLNQARQRVASAVIEDGRLDAADIAEVQQKKRRLLKDNGLLEYFPVEDNQFELGGFENLKDWLDRASVGFAPEARAVNLPPPRGLLLVGVQGCGKSLAAKAVARRWNLPLLKLDAGSLYNKYIGETEHNFRKAVRLAESLSPVVLWIDEMEKAFSTGSSQGSDADGGTSMRVLGSFLTWLQEKNQSVFVVGTANNIEILPPELLRKGRFDEIFFVDLPDEEERRKIFEIHLRLRNQDPAAFDIQKLSYATEGFSGSEIEQVVVAGLYRALYRKRQFDTEILIHESMETVPLSLSRREDIEALRTYAQGRFVSVRRPAHPEEDQIPPQIPFAEAV